MSLYFEVNESVEVDDTWELLAGDILEKVLDYLKCPYECEISILLTDDNEIHQVNMEQRQMDRATDVLSFPMVEWEKIGEYDWLEESVFLFHPESGELVLGDIVISVDTLCRQAQEYGHSTKREFAFLIVHSLLHLFGHDHMEEDERIAMEEEQRKIMDILEIHR